MTIAGGPDAATSSGRDFRLWPFAEVVPPVRDVIHPGKPGTGRAASLAAMNMPSRATPAAGRAVRLAWLVQPM